MQRDTKRAWRMFFTVLLSMQAWEGWKLYQRHRMRRIMAHRELRKALRW